MGWIDMQIILFQIQPLKDELPFLLISDMVANEHCTV
jgi:hypothetical protein